MLTQKEREGLKSGFAAKCREHRLAVTFHRQTVYESLLDRTDHPSADAVYETVRKIVPQISRASVFRILDTLSETGMIQKIMTPGSAARYDGNIQAHCHLVCDCCDRVIDWDNDCIRRLKISGTVPEGFHIREVSVNFSGVCRECQAAQAGDTPTNSRANLP